VVIASLRRVDRALLPPRYQGGGAPGGRAETAGARTPTPTNPLNADCVVIALHNYGGLNTGASLRGCIHRGSGGPDPTGAGALACTNAGGSWGPSRRRLLGAWCWTSFKTAWKLSHSPVYVHSPQASPGTRRSPRRTPPRSGDGWSNVLFVRSAPSGPVEQKSIDTSPVRLSSGPRHGRVVDLFSGSAPQSINYHFAPAPSAPAHRAPPSPPAADPPSHAVRDPDGCVLGQPHDQGTLGSEVNRSACRKTGPSGNESLRDRWVRGLSDVRRAPPPLRALCYFPLVYSSLLCLLGKNGHYMCEGDFGDRSSTRGRLPSRPPGRIHGNAMSSWVERPPHLRLYGVPLTSTPNS